MESALSLPKFSCASMTSRILVLLGELSCGADDLIDKPGQIHGLEIEVELAGFDLREVKDDPRIQRDTATSGTLVLRENPDADVPGCNADDEGENDRGLTTTDTKTRSLNQAPPVRSSSG
jgi:hypothetical protein